MATPLRLGLLASGRGSNVEAILLAISEGRLEAEAVVLVCDRLDAPVVDVASRFGVRVELVPREAHASRMEQQARIADLLAASRVDLVVLAGWAAILDAAVVDCFEGRILNIHPSLLPAFGGSVAPGPQAAALRAGVTETGCTVHVVTNDVDAGPILAQAVVAILPDDTVERLAERILAEEHRLYPAVLQQFAEGRLSAADGRRSLRSG